MRRAPREGGINIRKGKFLEAALLGRPNSFETGLPIEEAMNKGKLIPLLRRNLKPLMQKTREAQRDDPTYPERPFMKRFLNDVEDGLAKRFNLPGSYEVRVYSTVDTVLDLGGIDFWIELYDSDKNKVLSDYKIDLKSNPNGRMGRMADCMYYCDEEIASDDDPGAIYAASDYIDLVDSATRHLFEGTKQSQVKKSRDQFSQLQL